MKTMTRMRTVVSKAALLVLAATAVFACAACLGGCKDSDALKKVVYNQLSDNVDYDSETKFYIHDDTAEQTSDTVSAKETSKDARTTSEVQNLVVYSSNPNTDKYKAKQSVWSPNPDFKGIEASSAVSFYKTDDKNAPEELSEEQSEDEEEEENESDDGASADDDKEGSMPSQTSKYVVTDNSTDGASKGDDKSVEKSGAGGTGKADGGDKDGDEGGDEADDEEDFEPDVDTKDPTQEPPSVDCIAAYGDFAVLVQMVGGKGALAAADEALLSSEFTTVFSDEGADSIKQGWTGNGGSGSADVDAIIDSGANCVLVLSVDELTSKQRKKLKEADVSVVQMYAMTNSNYVKKNVTAIGDMLATSAKIQTDFKPVDKADSYVDFVQDLLEDTCATANGDKKTLAGPETLELSNTKKYSYVSDAPYTLLLDEFDEDASFKGDVAGWTPKANGVFLCELGYQNRATSFYIQAGGLQNNSAVKGRDATGLYVAHQFNSNIGTFDKTCFTKTDLISASLTRKEFGTGWSSTLFCADGGDSSDTTLSNTSINFGSDSFKKVITRTQKAKERLVSNSSDDNGLYHPFGLTSHDLGNFFGKYTSEGASVLSCIGVPKSGKNNIFDGAIDADNVEVNPTGLFASWAEGTSAEAVLEAAWICDVVNDSCGETSTGWKEYTTDFYDKFYRYDLKPSDFTTMQKGE